MGGEDHVDSTPDARSLTLQNSALAILAAVASDTLSKVAIGAAIGCGRFAVEPAAMAVTCFLTAGLAFGLTVAFVPG